MKTTAKRLVNALTTIPRDLDLKDVLKNSAIFGGTGIVAALLLSRKNKLRNSIIGGVLGAALGGYGTAVAKNIRGEMGGHYRLNPEYYNTEKLLEKAKKSGKDSIVLYVAGADDTPGAVPTAGNREASEGVFTYRWGDGKYLAKAVKALKEAGHKVDIIGHSAGATAIFDALDKDKLSSDSIQLLDPVDLSYRPLLNRLYNKYQKMLNRATNSSTLHVALDREYDESNPDTIPNKSVAFNPLAVTDIPGIKTIKYNDNHGMHTTGLRRPWRNTEIAKWLTTVRNRINNIRN